MRGLALWKVAAIGGVAGILALVVARLSPGDTMETVFAEPSRRAAFQMNQLEVAARRIWANDGLPPGTLQELVDAVPAAARYAVDPWGNAFQVLAADTVFVLRSLGADSTAGTWDDIVQASTMDTFWYVRPSEVPEAWSAVR